MQFAGAILSTISFHIILSLINSIQACWFILVNPNLLPDSLLVAALYVNLANLFRIDHEQFKVASLSLSFRVYHEVSNFFDIGIPEDINYMCCHM